MRKYTKIQVPNKKYQTNTIYTFGGTWSASALRYFGADHFDRYHTKIYGKQEELLGNKF